MTSDVRVAQRGGRGTVEQGGEEWQPLGNVARRSGEDGGSFLIKASLSSHQSESNAKLLQAVRNRDYNSVLEQIRIANADVNAADSKGNTSLHIASLTGCDDIVRVLVETGAKLNVKSQKGFTALYMAAQENHLNIVRFLLEHGANQNIATEDGFTPQAAAAQRNHSDVVALLADNDTKSKVRLQALHAAAKKDDVHAAMALLRADPNQLRSNKIHSVNETTKSGFTPLHIAAHHGSSNVACILLENGANVNYRAWNDVTPLHVAGKWGKNNIVGLLIDNNADMEARTKDNLTPLHCAARSGHDLVVEILVVRGANVSSKSKNGLTPLHMAVQGDHVESARILLQYKADMEEVSLDYLTPLHVAAHCGNVRTAKLLLDTGCVADSRALNGFTPLHVACKKNRIKVIELLLRYGAAIEATTESGLTPLHVASFLGHTAVITLLLDKSAEIEKPTLRGETALHLAARANQIDVIRLLLRNGANADAKAKEHQTPLHVSSRLGSIEAVSLLLSHGANKDAATKELYTPLHIAVKEGHEEIIECLLDNGAKQKLKTKKGFTPLHIAAKYGNAKVAKLLLQKHGNPNVEGKNGLTPLHVATHYNNAEIADLLLENGANVHTAAKNGYTPLHIAAKRDHIEIAKIILDHGGKPNAESKNGFTALHLASQEGHSGVASLLLERKADAKCKSKSGLTPMHLAAQEDHVPVAEILVKHGSPIDMTTKAGYTPLHTACHFGQLNMIKFLLEHGASVNAATKLGYTPLHQAAQQGHVLVINLLLKHHASPDLLTDNGQTPLSIARKMGFISVVEVLKSITAIDSTTPGVDDGYNIVYPETMMEVMMDSDEEGGDDVFPSTPKSDRYQSGQEMHLLQYEGDDLANRDDILENKANGKMTAQADKYKNIQRPNKGGHARGQDLFEFESQSGRYSTLSSVGGSFGGHDTLHEELRYMQEDSEYRYNTMTPSTAEQGDDLKYLTYDSDSRHGAATPSSVGACDDLKYHLPDDSQEFSDIWSPAASEYAKNTYKHATNVNGSSPYPNQSGEIMDEMQEHRLAALQYGMLAPPTAKITGEYEQSEASFESRVEREPIYSGFLVSFMVDARGGVMTGKRHSGIRFIIPSGRATMPTRIICKLTKKEKLKNPPPLMEGEVLANRILEMGNAGIKFSGRVLIEIPHFASLQGKDREIVIMRSDNGFNWYEHPIQANDEAIKQAIGSGFNDLESGEDLFKRKVARILTDSFPHYFAIVTRMHQDTKTLGPKGGFIVSSVAPTVQAQFPEGALTKAIKIGLQAQPIDDELVKKTLGENIYVSPVVTIEPRHRKFHQPIGITIPLPVSSDNKRKSSAGSPTLRLLCSIVGGVAPSQWEDITGSSPLTLSNDCVSFTTTVSARFWLMECPNINNCARMANELFRESIAVPMLVRFAVFGRRRNAREARLRAFCMTDDRMEKTLEKQQNFKEIGRSKDVEVHEGRILNVDVIGNMEPVLKTDEQLSINFHSLHENRIHMLVRLKDTKADANGQIVFLPETKTSPSNVRVLPICVLGLTLPEVESETSYSYKTGKNDGMTPGVELQQRHLFTRQTDISSSVDRADLSLKDVADTVENDWMRLANELGIDEKEVERNSDKNDSPNKKGLVMLHMWTEKRGNAASGNVLEHALGQIGRDDVIYKCMRNLERVTDEQEMRSALMSIEQGMTSTVEDLYDDEQQTKTQKNEDVFERFSTNAAHPNLKNDAASDGVDDLEVGGNLKIFSDIREGLPQFETDIQETEEVLDDGTIIKRKTTTTQQKQKIFQRVVMEGPEDELPGSEEQAEEVLRQHDVHDPGMRRKDEEDSSQDVQEFEETLEDGEVVKRRIVTTTSQQMTKEKVFLNDEEDDDDE